MGLDRFDPGGAGRGCGLGAWSGGVACLITENTGFFSTLMASVDVRPGGGSGHGWMRMRRMTKVASGPGC